MPNKQVILYYDSDKRNCFLSEEAAVRYNWKPDSPIAVFPYETEINVRPQINEETVMYHYCSFSAFMSIVHNKCFWLTNPLLSNDSEELIWATKQLNTLWVQYYTSQMRYTDEMMFDNNIRSELQAIGNLLPDFKYDIELNLHSLLEGKTLHEKKEILLRGLVDFFRYFIEELRKQISPTYVFCLSLGFDKLSQWRGYGDDGAGIAIGIKAKTQNEYEKTVEGLSVHQVAYYQYDQMNMLQKGLFDSIIDKDNVKGWISNILPVFKPIGFREEEECRMIYIPNIVKNGLKFRYLQKVNELRWYYELPIYSDTISEIIIGPKCKVSIEEIFFIMKYNGFDIEKSQIKKSQLTYR